MYLNVKSERWKILTAFFLTPILVVSLYKIHPLLFAAVFWFGFIWIKIKWLFEDMPDENKKNKED